MELFNTRDELVEYVQENFPGLLCAGASEWAAWLALPEQAAQLEKVEELVLSAVTPSAWTFKLRDLLHACAHRPKMAARSGRVSFGVARSGYDGPVDTAQRQIYHDDDK